MRLRTWGTLILLWGTHAYATPSTEERLQTRVQEHQTPGAKPLDWRVVADKLEAPPATTNCVEAGRQVIAGTYVLTSDKQNRPCRLYDLSFPTLMTNSRVNIGRLPLQTFGARDYLDWLEGRYEQVLGRIGDFRGRDTFAQPEWARGLRFKNVTAARVPGTSLPLSFAASDLEIGSTFRWGARDAALMARLGQVSEEWQEVFAKPESFLAKIKFDWNELEKVYEITIEGQFLPLRGPMVLVDFDRSYRMAVQTLVRSLAHSALSELTKVIPAPARNLITIAIDDGFEFADMAYAYQMNRLEQTLNHQTQLDPVTTERAANILAGGRADFVAHYLKAILTKQPFDWSQFEDLGRTIRYDAQRKRDVTMSRLNSRMVLEDGCVMSLVYDYFGVCTKGAQTRLHTMITDLSIMSWNLGAPVIHDPQSPSRTLLRRGAAYMLSVGSRLVTIPHFGFLMQKLTQISKQFAFAGIVDEGFLRGQLHLQQGGETAFEAELSRWLYPQNLNAFLPKDKASEDAIIKANAQQLGVEIQ